MKSSNGLIEADEATDRAELSNERSTEEFLSHLDWQRKNSLQAKFHRNKRHVKPADEKEVESELMKQLRVSIYGMYSISLSRLRLTH